MSNQQIKICDYCDDGNGECVYPYYGLAPHTHQQGVLGSTEFTAAEFLHILESEDKIIENNMYYLEQYGEKMN